MGLRSIIPLLLYKALLKNKYSLQFMMIIMMIRTLVVITVWNLLLIPYAIGD
jgi:hypothetical protein